MAPFIIASYLSDAHRQVLLALSKVSSMYTCVFPAYIQALLHAHDFFTSLKPRPACIDFICRPRCKGTFSSCNYSCAYLSPSRCFVSPTAFHLVSTMKKTINLYARSFCKWWKNASLSYYKKGRSICCCTWLNAWRSLDHLLDLTPRGDNSVYFITYNHPVWCHVYTLQMWVLQLCDEDTQHICKSGSTKQRHCYPFCFNGATAISLCRRNCEQRKQVCEGLYMLSLHFVAMITPYLILELLDKDWLSCSTVIMCSPFSMGLQPNNCTQKKAYTKLAHYGRYVLIYDM